MHEMLQTVCIKSAVVVWGYGTMCLYKFFSALQVLRLLLSV